MVVDAESEESLLVITGIKGRINRAVWGPLNRTIITAGEDATIRSWDTEVSSDYLFALVLPTIAATSTHH